MLSRNQIYEQKQRQKGLSKKTFWIPKHCEIEIAQIIEFCTENRDYIPFMCRSLTTGKMKKGAC
jgi:hypothetical protein